MPPIRVMFSPFFPPYLFAVWILKNKMYQFFKVFIWYLYYILFQLYLFSYLLIYIKVNQKLEALYEIQHTSEHTYTHSYTLSLTHTHTHTLCLCLFPVAQMVEYGATNAKIMGSIPRESKSWSNVKL